jgi:hypothetical protein
MMPKLYDIHGVGSVVDIDRENKRKTYLNHSGFVSKHGINTKVVLQEVEEGGKKFVRCTVMKEQDETPILKLNEFDKQNFKKFGDWAETFRIPPLFLEKLKDQGVDINDQEYLQNYLEIHHPEYCTTPKQLTKKRIVI